MIAHSGVQSSTLTPVHIYINDHSFCCPIINMDTIHIYINDHSFVVQSSTWTLFTFISMITHLLSNHQHGYFSHLYQWSLICCPVINMDTFHININDHSFVVQSSTWILFTFISMITHLLSNHQHGYFSHLYQWSLIQLSDQLHGLYFFVHRNFNTAWYNRSHSLIEKPYLAIIARNDSQKSQQSSGHGSLFIIWNDVIFKNSC